MFSMIIMDNIGTNQLLCFIQKKIWGRGKFWSSQTEMFWHFSRWNILSCPFQALFGNAVVWEKWKTSLYCPKNDRRKIL